MSFNKSNAFALIKVNPDLWPGFMLEIRIASLFWAVCDFIWGR